MKILNNGTVGLSTLLLLALLMAFSYLVYSRIIYVDPGLAPSDQSSRVDNKSESLMFTAAGDFNSTEEAGLVLEGISSVNSDFTLALGDLGYINHGGAQSVNEAEWCDFVTSRVGAEHPFELVAGNHDDGTRDGDITEYVKCLPNKMDGLVGDYGVEYYFDYQGIARFIMISPDINNYGYDYVDGRENLQWVINTIKEARLSGINWIVLGMHKNCITPGVKSCEIGDDLLNVAVDMKVDLVLQGHEHAYFRSKQLALNKETCPAIIVNEFNQECVAGEGDMYSKNEGTIIVITGAGGYRLRDVNHDDPEIEYFESINAKNSGNSYGFSLFSVSQDEIKASFVPVTGAFSDSFTIN